MLRSLGAGLAAGAAGTTALNAATYLDVAVRARPPSSVPSDVTGSIAGAVGLDALVGDDDTSETRRDGAGALLGYLTGVGAGLVAGIVRPRFPGLGTAPFGLAVGLGTMVAADLPSVATGATDPRTWGTAGWLADLVPHVVFGLVTATVLDRLLDR